MFHREFLWPTSAKWVQTLIFCIIVIRNGLNTKRSSHFWLNFMFLVQLLIFLLTGNDICHSQPKPQHFIIFNASHSMHCGSVEAYLLWKCCSFPIKLLHLLISDNRMLIHVLINHELLGIFYLWYYLWQENCAINAQSGYSNKTAVIVIISMPSLVSIEQQSPRRPCDIMPFYSSL